MNKIQIKAEFLILISKLEAGDINCVESIAALKEFEDKKYIIQLALKEAVSGDEGKLHPILFVLSQVVEGANLEELLWGFIKDNEYPTGLAVWPGSGIPWI